MRKSMRRADAKLDAARKYVSSYTSKPQERPKGVKVESAEQVAPQTIEPQERPKGVKVESAEIKKLEKGYFFVVVVCNGKKYEVEKRFKSTTKAQEWISKHEYIEL
jgi:predicted RNA-binding protein associated with RNAse of E/G family